MIAVWAMLVVHPRLDLTISPSSAPRSHDITISASGRVVSLQSSSPHAHSASSSRSLISHPCGFVIVRIGHAQGEMGGSIAPGVREQRWVGKWASAVQTSKPTEGEVPPAGCAGVVVCANEETNNKEMFST